MRLAVLDARDTGPGGWPLTDLMRILLHRPGFYGEPFSTWVHGLLRGPSAWSPGERELVATVVSGVNRCAYCAITHGAVAQTLLQDGDAAAAVAADWRSAPVDDRLRAAFALAERLSTAPDEVTAADLGPLREAGADDAAIADVVHIAAAFNIINRLANALDAAPPTPEQAAQNSAILARGYLLPP